ncbi:MAG: hypothetical protein E2590_14440 [Chryseobacterium sp.]|nr:hypothetical protein [Chryseobacterium sp.]
MKITLATILIILSNSFFNAQQNYKMFTGPLASINKDYEKSGHDIIGHPYSNLNFLPATIGDSQDSLPIRYDAYIDQVETLIDDKVYELPKSEKFSTLKFKGSSITIIYLKEDNGYFFQLVDGKNQLLKKEKIKVQVVKSSIEPNSTIKDGYSKFERVNPTYFIKTEKNLIKIPKNEKELINYFPEQKSEIENFIKTNKIKIKQEESMIKLVKFLNTL